MFKERVDADGAGLRRSARTKPNGKLKTYSDIQSAKLPSSSSEPSNSEPPSGHELSSSDDPLSSEDSDATSDRTEERVTKKSTRSDLKRKSESDTELSSARSSTEDEDQSDAGDEEDAQVQAGERDGDKIWKILDGDKRTPLAVGVAAPKRLRLRFHNRRTGEIREFNYKRGNPDAIRNIDWDNKYQIEDIMRWRNQIFNRLKFPVRKTVRWTDEEVSFLTLVYEKCTLTAALTKRITLPSRDAIAQLFMDEFGDRHGRDNIVQRNRRKNSGRLLKLKARLEGNLKPDGGPEYQLTIAEGELDAYMEDHHVRLAFDPAEYERIT